MSAYLFSAAQTATLYRLTCQLTQAAARPDPEPVDASYAILFNPESGRFTSRLIPNQPLPADPLQDLSAAGFVPLFGITQYRKASDGRGFAKPDFRELMLAMELETRTRPLPLRFSAWAWLTQGDRSPRRMLELLLRR